MPKELARVRGAGSDQHPLFAFGDIDNPIVITGPTAEVDLGFFKPHDKSPPVEFDCIVQLAQTPAATAAFVTCAAGSRRGSVLISVWTAAYAAAAGGAVTKVRLIAARGSAVGK